MESDVDTLSCYHANVRNLESLTSSPMEGKEGVYAETRHHSRFHALGPPEVFFVVYGTCTPVRFRLTYPLLPPAHRPTPPYPPTHPPTCNFLTSHPFTVGCTRYHTFIRKMPHPLRKVTQSIPHPCTFFFNPEKVAKKGDRRNDIPSEKYTHPHPHPSCIICYFDFHCSRVKRRARS